MFAVWAACNRDALLDGVTGKRTIALVKRKFHVTLLEHEDGVSVSCPELPGCHSQGANVEEALQNIQDAIHGYVESLKKHGEPIPVPIRTALVEVMV